MKKLAVLVSALAFSSLTWAEDTRQSIFCIIKRWGAKKG